jgi:hypothetical protein
VEGGRLGSFSWSVCKEKREETRDEEEKGHLAEIYLNFKKKIKSGPIGGGVLPRSDQRVVETILQVFRIFKQVEKRFW